MRLILLLMLLPIILYPLQKPKIVLSQVPSLLIIILLFLSKREKFIQIPLQLLNIITLLYLLHGLDILIILHIHTLILILTVLG